jgi:ferric-dicitrate binding protein FerR (iron transport regulator)
MNFHDHIDRSFDGQLSEEEWAALQRAIVDDPELRRDYVERRWLHAILEAESESLPGILEEPQWVKPAPDRRSAAWLAAAAAVVLFGGSLVLFFHSRPEPVVATLIEAENCRWAGSDLPTVEGAGLGAGTLALTEGMATIRFKSGATVTLEAPSVLEVESAMRCRLVEGSVVADVPESAHGFTIDTTKMEVIDLGTRFGVTTTPLGDSNVFVFEGEVKVKREDLPEAKHVFAGKSLVSKVGAIPEQTDQEVRRVEAPTASPGPDWTAITTATGRGRDAYLRRGDQHGPTGAHPLLMVKHTDLAPNNERRTILSFDLAGIDRATLRAARLALKLEPSGLGFSSLVPDSRFAVYGISGESAAAWSESEIIWKTAGPLVDEPLSAATATRLAEFEIRKGSPNGLVEVGSDAFVDFLRSRPDEIVSLMIVRETGESDQQGLVHAFASKEHPTAPAPTLWLQAGSGSQ